MTILGLDFGEKRVGVARSDELNFMAHPVGFILRSSDDQLIDSVQKIIKESDIEKIVVGLPKTLKGETGTQANKVLRFIELLKNKIKCPIVTWDERLTTAQAEKALLGQDVSRQKRKLKRDAISAEIMLQSYLDFLRHKGV